MVLATTALAIWLVASPAFAADPPTVCTCVLAVEPPPSPTPPGVAPFCDDRGATALAPPPMLQTPDSSLGLDDDVAADCAGAPSGKTFRPQPRPGTELRSGEAASIVLARVVATVPEADRQVCVAPREHAARPSGVRMRVERPPRG